jgi:hypothetical protein
MSTLLFFHVLLAMFAVGGLIAAAIAARFAAWDLARRSAAAAVAAIIMTVALGEGLAANENASGPWLDASRGLTVFGLLVGGAALAVVTGLARTRPRLRPVAAATAALLVLIALATVFVMAAKPS